jgi:hypothetical protein
MTYLQKCMTALLVAGIGLATGCMKTEQRFTMYPDGSGKMAMKQTIFKDMAAMVKSQAQEGGKPFDPASMLKDGMPGKVYWSNVKAVDNADGSLTITGTGYFENVSDLKPEKGTISFAKDGDGYVFEMTQPMPDEFKAQPGETADQKNQREQGMAMMKGMMAGFEMTMGVTMPGAIKASEGMEKKDDRNAEYKMTDKDLTDIMDQKKQPVSKMRVTCGASTADAEMAAFKKELEAAKAGK